MFTLLGYMLQEQLANMNHCVWDVMVDNLVVVSMDVGHFVGRYLQASGDGLFGIGPSIS